MSVSALCDGRGRGYALLHYFLVIYRISNIDVRLEGDVGYSGIEVQDVWRRRLGVQVRIDALDEGRLARACHSNGDDGYWLFGRRRRRRGLGVHDRRIQ